MALCSGGVRRARKFAAAIAAFAALAGCGRLPPKVAGMALPAAPAGLARAWFYREDQPYVSLARPYVRMNGAIVGISEPGGAFYRDVAPGGYYVTVDSYGVDVNQFPHAVLVPGETAYFEVLPSRSWASGSDTGNWVRPTFYVRQMPRAQGAPAVARSLFYAGGD